MDMSGERLIPASRDVVWQSLNDPSVLQVAIPGCQQLERAEGDALRAVAAVKVGPITARFAGKVSLLDLDPPNSYRIEGEGQGGAAGFAKGGRRSGWRRPTAARGSSTKSTPRLAASSRNWAAG